MATIDIGKLTFTHKGDYAGGTAYVANDVVYYNGSAYIAKTSTTGNLPTSTAHWNTFATGSGGIWNAGLSIGTAGQVVKVNSGANALEFGTVTSGEYSIHKVDSYSHTATITHGGVTSYIDLAQGNTVSFQPTSTNDKIYISHMCSIYSAGQDYGTDTYMMMKAGSSSIGSGDTKLNFTGQHANYISQSSFYHISSKSFILPCTSLSTSTVYYLEQAGGSHTSNNNQYNYTSNDGSGDYRAHTVNLIHYKKNS
mgnify:CR=1 FL=1